MLYNPLEAPNPADWLALPDEDRFAAVEAFHVQAELAIGYRRTHCSMHVTVENLVAKAGATLAASTDSMVAVNLERLVKEGLDRHEAIHAIMDVIYGAFLGVMAGESSTIESDKYREELTTMTAEKWRKVPPPW